MPYMHYARTNHSVAEGGGGVDCAPLGHFLNTEPTQPKCNNGWQSNSRLYFRTATGCSENISRLIYLHRPHARVKKIILSLIQVFFKAPCSKISRLGNFFPILLQRHHFNIVLLGPLMRVIPRNTIGQQMWQMYKNTSSCPNIVERNIGQ